MTPLSRIFGTTCPDSLQIPSKSLAQVHVRTSSEAQETFRGLRRKRHGCRPNRTPAAGRRDRRQSIGPPQPFPSPRRARQAEPGASPVCGLPLVQPPRRFRCAHGTAAVASRLDAVEACLPRRGSGGGGVARRVFRARRDWRRAGSPRGADAEAKASGFVHLAESCRGCRPKKLGASSSPRRSVGQRVCLPLPCQKIRDKGGRGDKSNATSAG